MNGKKPAVFLGVALACLGVWAVAQERVDWPRPELRAFMRKKLEHTNGVLEGVVTHDAKMIRRHAEALDVLCVDESWNVIRTREYDERSQSFRRTLQTMKDMGKRENFEGAALAYIQLTTQCFDCHNAMRLQAPAIRERKRDDGGRR